MNTNVKEVIQDRCGQAALRAAEGKCMSAVVLAVKPVNAKKGCCDPTRCQ